MDELDVDLTDRDLARMLSFSRIVVGATAFLAPHWMARRWTGENANETVAKLSLRGLGARDIALGLGTLFALEGDGPVRGWIQAQALADASDAAGTLMNFKHLPGLRRFLLLGAEVGAVFLAVRIAETIDN